MKKRRPDPKKLLAEYRKRQNRKRPKGNPVGRFFSELAFLKDLTFARQSFAALFALLTVIDHRWQLGGINAHIWNHSKFVLSYLSRNQGLGSVLRQVYEKYQPDLMHDEFLNDSTALLDFGTLINFLSDQIAEALPTPANQETKQALDGLQPRLATELIIAAQTQVLKLKEAILGVVRAIESLQWREGRVVLLEFPIGNSLPTKLLDGVLRRNGIAPIVVRVALSRNNSKQKGITRRELLESKLKELNLGESDLVVLIDEWLSGSNFRTLTDLLRKLPSVKNASFLPVALLTNQSSGDPRFASHVEEHDKLLTRVGQAGGSLRFLFPPLNSQYAREGYFFWSEHDRLAGYRKFQTLGAHLSSIDEMIEKLKSDQELRRQAKARVIAEMMETIDAKEQASLDVRNGVADGGYLDQLFEEGYEDYQLCKPILQSIELASAQGDDFEILSEIREMSEKVHEVVDDRPAKICVLTALFLMRAEHIVDSPNPYYLDGHAPAVVELGGGFARLNESILQQIEEIILAQ